ncbi:MAG: flagellar cap protein FliD N-terminal domain-containing protein, partial [Planctomycetota bacterium]
MAGPIRFDGLVSGIDFTSIVEKMVALQKRPITFLQDQVKTETARKAGLLTISARLISLKGIIGQLGKTTFFDRTVVSSSNESILKASGSNVQSTGAFSFTVRKLAQAHQLVSTGLSSKSTALGGGEISVEFGDGFVDRKTSVDFLNGQTGIDRGVLRLRTSAGQSVNVDMTDAITVQDVVDRLNNNGVLSITATVDNDSLAIANGTGSTLFVEDVDADTTATSLGINGSVGIGLTLRGSRINTITGSTETRLLNDGLGVRSASGNDLQVTTRDGSTFFVDFDATDARVQDVLDAVNNATGNGGRVVARVNAQGNAIELLDTTAGAGNLAVASQGSSNAAIDLGFVGVTSELNGVPGAAGSNYLLGKRVIPSLNSILKRTLNGGSSEFRPIDGVDPDGIPNGTITIRGRNGTTTPVDVSTRTPTTLATAPVYDGLSDTTSFNVALTDGLAVGNEIRLVNGAGLQETRTITGISGPTVTVAGALSNPYVIGDSALSSNQTLQDLINAIDNAAGQNLAVSFNNAGNGLLIRDTTAGPIRALMITGTPAESLGIDTKTTGLKGDSLGTLTTLVDANLVGYGADYFKGATVTVTAGTNTGYSQVVDSFDGTTGTLTFLLPAGAAFDATSEYEINAVLGDREVGTDLDPQYIGDNTLLSTLNQGKGVFAGRFTVTDSNGLGFTVDLRQSDDDAIGAVLEEINGAASAVGSDLRARINDTGDGIVLIDPTGAGAIRVVDLDGGTTAEDLNIEGSAPAATPGTLDGTFERTF